MTKRSEISVDILTHPDDIKRARRLQAQCYLRRHYVNEIQADGTIDDPWVDTATYFGARKSCGQIVGVSRLIPQPVRSQLPVHRDFDLDEYYDDWILQATPGGLFEVSALAVAPRCGFTGGRRVLDALIGAMSSYSLKAGAPYWVAALDAKVFHHLRRVHDANLTQMGPSRMYMGSITVPIRLDLLGQFADYDRRDPAKNAYFLRDSDLLELDLSGERAVLHPRWSMRPTSVYRSDAEARASVPEPFLSS